MRCTPAGCALLYRDHRAAVNHAVPPAERAFGELHSMLGTVRVNQTQLYPFGDSGSDRETGPRAGDVGAEGERRAGMGGASRGHAGILPCRAEWRAQGWPNGRWLEWEITQWLH